MHQTEKNDVRKERNDDKNSACRAGTAATAAAAEHDDDGDDGDDGCNDW